MAERKPLVLINGAPTTLPSNDTIAAGSDSEKVLVSNTDSTANYLSSKISAGDGIVKSIATSADAALLHILGNGTNGSTVLTDLSPHNRSVSNAALSISTTQQKYGSGSIYCPGTGTATVPNTNSVWSFGTRDFTVMWWERQSSITDNRAVLFIPGTGGMDSWIGYNANGKAVVYLSTDAAWAGIANGKSMGTLTLDEWVHKMLVRSGNNFYTFRNGDLVDTWSSSASMITCTGPIQIGGSSTYNYNTQGYIQDFAIFPVALYTENFNPAQIPSPEQVISLSADISTATPQPNGTAAAGSTGEVSDAGHVHPTDTSRAAASHAHDTLTFPEQASAPATPASGYVILYALSDGKLYIKDDAGTETCLT